MRGIIYLAFGKQYQSEARRSIASVRVVSPDLRIAVITDSKWNETPLPDEFILQPAIEGFNCKPEYMYNSPFLKTLYLDTDTIVARDITPVFGLLNYYDIGVQFGGPQMRGEGDLEFHTQCNSGVVLFRKNDVTKEFFSIWKQEYKDHLISVRAKSSIPDTRGLNDQRSFAKSIAKSKVRPIHLAEYLNFVLFTNSTTLSPPVVYHGRLPKMEYLHREIAGNWDVTRDWHPRTWLPNIRGILPMGVSKSDPLLAAALILRRIYNDVKRNIAR